MPTTVSMPVLRLGCIPLANNFPILLKLVLVVFLAGDQLKQGFLTFPLIVSSNGTTTVPFTLNST